ncbi:MAG: hypothetical protein ACR2J6_04235 [Thermoleophilaceae bacterium]
MDQNQFFALLGFAFAAAWTAFSFGSAVLCLLAAGLFYLATSVARGEIDLGETQDRLSGHPRTSPRSPARPRVR